MRLVFPETTGALCAKMDRGLSGQDAVNGMVMVFLTGPCALETGNYTKLTSGGVSGALNCMHDQQAVVYPGVGITSPENRSNPQPGDPSCALTNDSRNYLVQEAEPPRKYIVRRLTPTECARLQGFPDEWCEGLGGSDSAIYKAYGNGLALPCAYDVMNRIARFVEHEKED